MYIFGFPFLLLDVLRQVTPLITTKYEKQRRQMEECYYIDDESSYSGSVNSSEIDYNEVEGEYSILTVMEEMMSRVIENHLTYIFSSYLPLNNCHCIMGTSQPALSLDKQKTISKVHGEQYFQRNKKPSHKFISCQAYLMHLSDYFNIRRTPFYLKIKDIEYQKSYRNNSIENFHRVGYAGLLLWIEHTQNHIIEYN